MMKHHLIRLFEYDKWANLLLFDKLEKQYPQNPRIYQLLSHLLSAQRIWFDRVIAAPPSTAIWAERIPDEMRLDIEDYNAAWLEFMKQLQENDLEMPVTYNNLQGVPFSTKLIDIITQVLNHGTHHHGGILMLMKEEGYLLPGLDFITFTRM